MRQKSCMSWQAATSGSVMQKLSHAMLSPAADVDGTHSSLRTQRPIRAGLAASSRHRRTSGATSRSSSKGSSHAHFALGALLQVGGSLSGRAGTLLGNVHERVFECTRGTSTSAFAHIEPSMPLHAVSPRFATAGMSKVATMAAPRRLGFGRAACSAHSQMSYRQIRSRRAQSNACPRGV